MCVLTMNASDGSSQPDDERNEHEMAVRGDREELGQALDDPEDESLDEAHGGERISGRCARRTARCRTSTRVRRGSPARSR